MDEQLRLGLVNVHRVSRFDRFAAWRTINWTRELRRGLTYAEAHSPIAARGYTLRQRGSFSKPLIDSLTHVASHAGNSLVLRNAIPIPDFYLNSRERARLRQDPEKSPFARRGALHLSLLMGAIQHVALVERHDMEGLVTFVHALGEEYFEGGRYQATPYKLLDQTATAFPNRPLGPALFGQQAGGRLDAVCPDLIAFIVLEKPWAVRNIGPLLFSVDQIEEVLAELGAASAIPHLRERHFEINPDQLMTQTKDLGFGGVRKVNILGLRDDGRKYMRFNIGRIFHPAEAGDAAELALKQLRTALRTLELRQKSQQMNLQRGDVLLVNNRRVATKWGGGALEKYGMTYGDQRLKRLSEGERAIVRMSFFSTREIPPDRD